MEKQKRILIVEDQPDVVQGLRQVFEIEGIQVSEASDGKTGLEKALVRNLPALRDKASDVLSRIDPQTRRDLVVAVLSHFEQLDSDGRQRMLGHIKTVASRHGGFREGLPVIQKGFRDPDRDGRLRGPRGGSIRFG